MAENKKLPRRHKQQAGNSNSNDKLLSTKTKKPSDSRVDGQLDLRETLWQLVASIPPGRVASYGQLARLAGFPNHARYVGTTLRHLPEGTTLPWFRVLRSSGELAFPPGSAEWQRQKALLEDEGIIFHIQKVSLPRYQWEL